MHSADVRYDERMESLKELIEQRAHYSEEAVKKVEVANEKRFESVNEFRQQLRDQATHFATRVEMEAKFASTTEALNDVKAAVGELQKQRANLDGRFTMLGVVITVMVVIINVVMKFIGPKQ